MNAIIFLSLLSLALGAAPNVYYYNHRPLPLHAPRAPHVIAPMAPRAPTVYAPAAYQHLTYHPVAHQVAPIAYHAPAPVAYAPAPVSYAAAPVVGHAYLPRAYAHSYPAVPVARPQHMAPEYQSLREYQPSQPAQLQHAAPEYQALQQAPAQQSYQTLQQAPAQSYQAMQQVPAQSYQAMQQVPAQSYQAMQQVPAQSYQAMQQVPAQSYQNVQSSQQQEASYQPVAPAPAPAPVQPEANGNSYGGAQGATAAQTTSPQQQDAESYARASGREVKYTIRDPQDPSGRMQVVEMQIESDRQMSPAEAEKMMKNVMGSMGMRSAESASNNPNSPPSSQPEEEPQSKKTDVRHNFNSFLKEIGFGSGF